MHFDIEKMAAMERYELLLGTVVPRPIAIVTTMAGDGAINAAPYSLFNGSRPSSRNDFCSGASRAEV